MKQTVSINERVIQYVFRIAAAALIIDENLYEKNFENIFEFIRNLQICDALTTRRRNKILTVRKQKSNVSKSK